MMNLLVLVCLLLLGLCVTWTNANCTATEFECDNRKCIRSEWQCDWANDCGDRSDELGCPCNSTYDRFLCKNDNCIKSFLACNKYNDCGDDSDEKNCSCAYGEFQCKNYKCIEYYKKCDHNNDCGDNSDEENCPCDSTFGWFQCNTSKCIPLYQHCDYYDNCGDYSDELGCQCDHASGGFRCNNSRCIRSYQQCDFYDNCGDNSDELGCACNSSVGKFLCNNSKCVYAYNKCNFNNDCGDNSDEANCTCDSSVGKFLCNNSKCVYANKKCDFNDDCGDNSDEANCTRCGAAWNNFLWQKCWNSVIYQNLTIPYYTYWETVYGYYPYSESSGWNTWKNRLDPTSCRLWTDFLQCLNKSGSLCTESTPNDGSDQYYYTFNKQIGWYNYVCTDFEVHKKYLTCSIYHTPNYILELNGCNQLIADTYNNETTSNNGLRNESFCRSQNGYLTCAALTFEKFEQRCGPADYIFHYEAYNNHGYSNNLPIYYNYYYGCKLTAPPSCQAYQDPSNGSCVDIAPAFQSPRLDGPTVINRTWIEFYCVLQKHANDSDARYVVTFLFDGKEASNVPRFNVSASDDRAILHEKYLAGNLGKSIGCRMFSYWATSPNKKSGNLWSNNEFWAGIQTWINNGAYVYENSVSPTFAQFTSTLPITCTSADVPSSCSLPFRLITTQDIVLVKQGNDSPCKAQLSETSRSYSFSVLARRDLFTTNPRQNNITIRFLTPSQKTTGGQTYDNMWSTYNVPNIPATHVDDQGSFCTTSGDPRVITFDSLSYSVYSSGQFYYVQAVGSTPFEVHVRHWPCLGLVACVCGIAVRENDVILGVDMCTDGIPHYITYTRGNLSEGFSMSRSYNGFQILVPSGKKVTGTISTRMMNIQIFLGPDALQTIQGICGTFNRNRYDDLRVFGTPKICANLVLNDLAPPDFLESWRIPKGKSLFDGYLTDIQPYYMYNNGLQCTTLLPTCCDCFSGYSVCGKAVAYVDDSLNPNSKKVIPKLVNPNSGQSIGRRRRKRSTDQQDDDDIDYDYNPDAYIYTRVNSSNDQNWNFTWPTSTGINETQAHNFCYTTLWLNATYRSLCPSLPADVIETVVQKCVRDVQISGNLDMARDKIPEMQSLCVYKTISTKRDGDPAAAINDIRKRVENIYLSGCDCNGNGECVNGTCQCIAAFTGVDCAIRKNAVPRILGLVSPNACDVHYSACRSVAINTANVLFSPNLVCRINVTKIDNSSILYQTKATSLSSDVTKCDLPANPLNSFSNYVDFESLRRTNFFTLDPGSPVLSYAISVSNDGKVYSNEETLLVYDSLCYACEDYVCTETEENCLINGYCFETEEPNPFNANKSCNPSVDKHRWSRFEYGSNSSASIGLIDDEDYVIETTPQCPHNPNTAFSGNFFNGLLSSVGFGASELGLCYHNAAIPRNIYNIFIIGFLSSVVFVVSEPIVRWFPDS